MHRSRQETGFFSNPLQGPFMITPDDVCTLLHTHPLPETFEEEHVWLVFSQLPGSVLGQTTLKNEEGDVLGFCNHVLWEGVRWSSHGIMETPQSLEAAFRTRFSVLPASFPIEHVEIDASERMQALFSSQIDFMGRANEAHKAWLRDWRQLLRVLLEQGALDTALPAPAGTGQRPLRI